MTPCELEEIENSSSDSMRAQAFCRHWAAKESCIKALGCGPARDPSSFAVAFNNIEDTDSLGDVRILDDSLPVGTTAFEVHAPEGYRAAACALKHPGRDLSGIRG